VTHVSSSPGTAVEERRRGPAGWLGLLREHDFRLFWTGETTSALGTNITRLALPLVAVVTLDASAFAVSALTAATWLPWLLIGLPAGAWIDRLPRRPVMLVCDVASLILLVSVPLAAFAGVLTLVHLLLVALLVGAAGVFFQTAHQVYLPGLVPAQHLPEANAKLQGSEAAAQVAGPGIAGLIAQTIGAVAGVLANAATFAVSAVCLLRIRTPERAAPVDSDVPVTGLREQVSQGLRFLVADPYLRVLTAYGALSNLALTGYQAILVVFLVREVGADPGVVGALLSGMSVGGLLGAVLATTIGRRLGTARGMLLANLAGGPFALLVPLTAPGPRLVLVVIGGIGVGAAIVAGNVLKSSFRQTYTPRPLLGRVVVSMQFLNYGTIPLGAILSGTLATALGLRPTMWIMVVGAALAPLTLLCGPLRRNRDFPARPMGLQR
jgi:MFS family permease